MSDIIEAIAKTRAKAIEECLDVLRMQRDVANAASRDKTLRAAGLDAQLLWASGVLSQVIDLITERVKP